MYNNPMPPDSYQIRSCPSCGLRYPLTDGHNFGIRCPACLGETRLTLRGSRKRVAGPRQSLPESLHREGRKEEKNLCRLAVLLDNIRSAWNVGSIFRSADGFGFAHAYLCGITPTPDGQARNAVTKTSLGAEDTVTWSHHKDAVKLVKGLKKEGWVIWTLEEEERATPITHASSASLVTTRLSVQRVVLIVGNEVTGVDPDLLDLCDEIFYIPMRGEKKSFNVAVAFAIAAFALR